MRMKTETYAAYKRGREKETERDRRGSRRLNIERDLETQVTEER